MIKVKMFVDVYEDNWEHGEGSHANEWVESFEIDTDDKIIAISAAMEKSCYSFKEDFLDDDEGVFRYSVMVDENNCEASSSELELFKKGEIVLYSASIEFKLYQIMEI